MPLILLLRTRMASLNLLGLFSALSLPAISSRKVQVVGFRDWCCTGVVLVFTVSPKNPKRGRIGEDLA